MKQFILIFAISAYSLASLIQLRSLTSKTNKYKTTFWILGIAAVITHGYLVLINMFVINGMNLGVFKALSLVAWMMATLILLATLKKPVECLAIVLFPLAVLTLILDHSLPTAHLVAYDSNWQLQAHIFISITAYSFLTIAVVQSIVLAIQDHQLHNRQPSGFIQSLPPLQIMEQLLFQIIAIGFILLTIGLLIGILFLQDITAQHLVHKTVLSSLAWTIFAILLWGRWRFGWRGRKAIRLALAGFIALMLAFIGTKIVIELILNRIN